MLEFQLFRDEHGADLQVARRALPPHPLEHLSPMLLPVLRQIEQKALVERSARGLRAAAAPGPQIVGPQCRKLGWIEDTQTCRSSNSALAPDKPEQACRIRLYKTVRYCSCLPPHTDVR